MFQDLNLVVLERECDCLSQSMYYYPPVVIYFILFLYIPEVIIQHYTEERFVPRYISPVVSFHEVVISIFSKFHVDSESHNNMVAKPYRKVTKVQKLRPSKHVTLKIRYC